jgi:hypothetical protein
MERLIGYVLAVPRQNWPVRAHRINAIASAIAGDGDGAMFVSAPDRHALLHQNVQYLLVRVAKGITGTGRDNTDLGLYLLYKSQ